jgi:hypothetical protein
LFPLSYLFTLPFSARVVALIVAAGLLLWAAVKRKAISALTNAARASADKWFWTFVYGRIQKVAPPPQPRPRQAPSNERTYQGKFYGCHQFANYPHEHYFTLIDGSTTIKVPVMKTNLFSGVQTGALVQIDTLTGVNYHAEVVQRVRVLEESV